MARAGKGKQKNYAAIAKQKLTKPSQVKPKRRFFIYGRKKRGKTSFCESVNEMKGERVLIVDPEHGTDWMKSKDPDVWHVTKWEDVDEVLGFLRLGKHPFTWVAFDGLTKINQMALKFIMRLGEETNLERRPGIVDRRDYNKSGQLMRDLIVAVDALPLGVIYTAQERVISANEDDETEEESTLMVPNLPEGVRNSTSEVVDLIGRIYVTKATFKKQGGGTVEKNQRRLWLGVHPQYDTGARSEFELPDLLKNPTVPSLIQLLDKGKVK